MRTFGTGFVLGTILSGSAARGDARVVAARTVARRMAVNCMVAIFEEKGVLVMMLGGSVDGIDV